MEKRRVQNEDQDEVRVQDQVQDDDEGHDEVRARDRIEVQARRAGSE